MKEMIIDFRNFQYFPPTQIIKGEAIERLESYSYLGVRISIQLSWTLNTKRPQKSLVKGTTLSDNSENSMYVGQLIISSINLVMCYCLICWSGSLSVKDRVQLNRIVWSASKIIGMMLPMVDELYESCVIKMTDILKDTSHPLH